MVPQLQFIEIFVDFPSVALRQIPKVLWKFLSYCTYGGRSPCRADAAGSTGARASPAEHSLSDSGHTHSCVCPRFL